MKRLLKTLSASLLIVGSLAVSAAAASFDHCADTLKDLGLFQGTAQGYELDRAPTRGEAAAMLVRLLGKEAEAKTLTYSAPFTDLDGWQKPYVQYLYDNKLTSGASATTFEPEEACTANMYAAFLLRALGYSETEDGYTYKQAVEKAYSIGLADFANCDINAPFLRDNVAAMSYTALTCPPKGETETVLLEKLVEDGSVDSAKAAPVLKTFETVAEYAADAYLTSQQTKVDMDADISMNLSMNDQKLMSLSMPMNMKMDMNLANMDQSKMSMKGTMKAVLDPSLVEEGASNTQEAAIEYYYADGVYYMNGMGEKIKMDMSFEDSLGGMTEMTQMQNNPISMIKSIEKSGDTYTVTYASGALGSMVNSILGATGMGDAVADLSFNIDEMTAKETVKNGQLSAMDMTMRLSVTVSDVKASMDMTMKCKVNATGDSVKVTLPTDLNTYQEMTGTLPTTPAA